MVIAANAPKKIIAADYSADGEQIMSENKTIYEEAMDIASSILIETPTVDLQPRSVLRKINGKQVREDKVEVIIYYDVDKNSTGKQRELVIDANLSADTSLKTLIEIIKRKDIENIPGIKKITLAKGKKDINNKDIELESKIGDLANAKVIEFAMVGNETTGYVLQAINKKYESVIGR